MSLFKCRNNCGCTTTVKRPQSFKDGSTHIREECAGCGSFYTWQKRGQKSFRQQAFEVVRNLAACESREQFILLKGQAQQLMELTNVHTQELKDHVQLELLG